jgi:hypothetical protein
MKAIREFYIWTKEKSYEDKIFKTEQLAIDYAKKLQLENYKIGTTYQFTK